MEVIEECKVVLEKKKKIDKEITSLSAVLEQKKKERDNLIESLNKKYGVRNAKELRSLYEEKEKELEKVLVEIKKQCPEVFKEG